MSEDTYLRRIEKDLVDAMKARDAATLSTLRMLKAAILEVQTKKPRAEPLSADEEREILQRYVKKRRETIEGLGRAGRADLVANEEREIAVTARYLPAELSEADLLGIVRETAQRLGATSPKEMGKVVGAVMAQVKGRADGTVVSRLVKEALGA